MPANGGVVDANVLAYAINADAAYHARSRTVASPCSPTQAQRIISALLDSPGIRVLSSPARVVNLWMELLRRHPMTGGDIFDLQLVATMTANDIRRIYTFNARDFEVFPQLEVLTPGLPTP